VLSILAWTLLFKPFSPVENILARFFGVCYSNFSPPCVAKAKASRGRLVLQVLIWATNPRSLKQIVINLLRSRAATDEKFSDLKHQKNSGTETSPTRPRNFIISLLMVKFWGFVYLFLFFHCGLRIANTF
jgi:hypothetical protein